MSRRLNLILICSLLFTILQSSCGHRKERMENDAIHNEDKLIKDLFWELANPLPPFAPEDSTMEAFELFGSEYATWLEENDFELYLRDSLFMPDKYWFHKREELNAYDSLYNNLFIDTSLSSRLFNLSLINYRSNIKIKLISPNPESDTLFQNINKKEFAGYVQFSRIKFDQKFMKACFFFDKHMGPLSGGSVIIYAEKRNGRWAIIKRDLIYVS
jgi:hypothetical protein